MKNTKASRNLIMVILGQIISLFGNAILRFALPFYILEQSGSPALFGLVSGIAFVPMIVLSLLGGVMADRLNKQRIMVYLDFGTAVLIGIFMAAFQIFSPIPLVIGTLMLLYGIQGAYQPAVQASLPLLVSGENLVAANAAVNLVSSLSGLLGPVIGGIVYAGYGLLPILKVSIVCFVVSAVMEIFIRIPHQKRKYRGSVLALIRDDMGQSMHYLLRENPVMVRVMVIVFGINLFMSSLLSVGMPVVITQTLGLGGEYFGYAEGGLALGGIAGGLLAGILGRRIDVRKAWLFLLGCAACMLPMGIALLVGASVMGTFLTIVVSFFLLMVISTVISVVLLAYVQACTPREIVGKVVSCVMALSMCAQPLGQTLYGALFEAFAASPWVLFLGGAVLTGIVALFSKNTFRGVNENPMAAVGGVKQAA